MLILKERHQNVRETGEGLPDPRTCGYRHRARAERQSGPGNGFVAGGRDRAQEFGPLPWGAGDDPEPAGGDGEVHCSIDSRRPSMTRRRRGRGCRR
jgi:hypothetical protein